LTLPDDPLYQIMLFAFRMMRHRDSPEALQMLRSRFKKYMIFDILVGCLYCFATTARLIAMAPMEGVVDERTILAGVVAMLFWVDAILMTWLLGLISREAAIREQCSAVNVNLVSNMFTVVVYMTHKYMTFKYTSHKPVSRILGMLVFFVIFEEKVSKIYLIKTFKHILRSQDALMQQATTFCIGDMCSANNRVPGAPSRRCRIREGPNEDGQYLVDYLDLAEAGWCEAANLRRL